MMEEKCLRILDGLFPTHQYGQQTTIGTIDI